MNNRAQVADSALSTAGLIQRAVGLHEENERLRRLLAAADQFEEAAEREIRALRLEMQELRHGSRPGTIEDTLRQLTDGAGRVHVDAAIMALRIEAARLLADNAELLRLYCAANPHDERAQELEALQSEHQDLQSEHQALEDILTSLDRDNAALISRNAELAAEIARLEEVHEASNQVHVARNAELAAEIARLNHAAAVDIEPSSLPWEQPEALAGLPEHERDYWYGAAAGRWRWRDLPRTTQVALVRHVLSFGAKPGSVTQAEFNAMRPHWMPTADSHAKTLGRTWSQLNDVGGDL
jgi:prefoldin subunit 5